MLHMSRMPFFLHLLCSPYFAWIFSNDLFFFVLLSSAESFDVFSLLVVEFFFIYRISI